MCSTPIYVLNDIQSTHYYNRQIYFIFLQRQHSILYRLRLINISNNLINLLTWSQLPDGLGWKAGKLTVWRDQTYPFIIKYAGSCKLTSIQITVIELIGAKCDLRSVKWICVACWRLVTSEEYLWIYWSSLILGIYRNWCNLLQIFT